MKKYIFLVPLLFICSVSFADIEWKAEAGLTPSSIKIPIESLNHCIDKYFSRIETSSKKIRIYLSSQLLPDEIITRYSASHLDIHISNAIGSVSTPQNMIKISSIFVVNKVVPDLPQSHTALPEWIACAFIFRSLENIKKTFIKLPRYPICKAIYESGFEPDFDFFLKNGSASADTISFKLKCELGWIILAGISKNSSEMEFVSNLQRYFSEYHHPNEADYKPPPNNFLPRNSREIIYRSVGNPFFCYSSIISEKNTAKVLSELLSALEKDYGNSNVATTEKEKSIQKAIESLNEILFCAPFFSQTHISNLLSKLSKYKEKNDYDKISQLISKIDLKNVFSHDTAIEEKMLISEGKFVSPGRRYSALLDILSSQNPEISWELIRK